MHAVPGGIQAATQRVLARWFTAASPTMSKTDHIGRHTFRKARVIDTAGLSGFHGLAQPSSWRTSIKHEIHAARTCPMSFLYGRR